MCSSDLHAIGLDKHARLFAEIPIASERQPLVIRMDAHLGGGTLCLS